MENWGATVDASLVGMFYLMGKTVLAEMTAWKDEEGPLALVMEGRPMLLEREEIVDNVYDVLKEQRAMVGGIGTNTYWIDIPGLLASVGLSPQELSDPDGRFHLLVALEQQLKPLYTLHTSHSRQILHTDARLSAITHFLDTQFVEVPRSRFSL
jgi:hypothetical protein